jgi:hypothetical protein
MASTEQAAVVGSSRIPVALQMIFLHSNRGFNVDKPPPAKVASKIFPRALALTKSRTSIFDSTEPRVAATSERSSDTAALQEEFDEEDRSCSEASSSDAGNDFSEVMDVESVPPKQVETIEDCSEVTEDNWVPPNQVEQSELQPLNFYHEIERVRLIV